MHSISSFCYTVIFIQSLYECIFLCVILFHFIFVKCLIGLRLWELVNRQSCAHSLSPFFFLIFSFSFINSFLMLKTWKFLIIFINVFFSRLLCIVYLNRQNDGIFFFWKEVTVLPFSLLHSQLFQYHSNDQKKKQKIHNSNPYGVFTAILFFYYIVWISVFVRRTKINCLITKWKLGWW